MKTATNPSLSSLVRDQIHRPSPIRQIMKMAERQNILAMGLDPANVISFGGGWVNHSAPGALLAVPGPNGSAVAQSVTLHLFM